MTEVRESYLTHQSEEYTALVMALSPAEQRLIYRLRQLVKQGQSRGAMILFESGGFGLFVLNKQDQIGT